MLIDWLRHMLTDRSFFLEILTMTISMANLSTCKKSLDATEFERFFGAKSWILQVQTMGSSGSHAEHVLLIVEDLANLYVCKSRNTYRFRRKDRGIARQVVRQRKTNMGLYKRLCPLGHLLLTSLAGSLPPSTSSGSRACRCCERQSRWCHERGTTHSHLGQER